MQKRVVVCAFIFVLIFSLNSLAEAHQNDPSMRKFLGLQPLPAQKIPQPASLLVTVVSSSTNNFIDANVQLYLILPGNDDKEGIEKLVQSGGTRAKHVFFQNILVEKNKKGEYVQDFLIRVDALDYFPDYNYIALKEGEYREEKVWLQKKRKSDMCKETDVGVDPLHAGIASYNPVPKRPELLKKSPDRCKGDDIIESYCSENDELKDLELKCPGRCKEGACVVEPYCVGTRCIPVENLLCYDMSYYTSTKYVNPYRMDILELSSQPAFKGEENVEKKLPENKGPVQVIPPRKIDGKVIAEAPAPVPAVGGGGGGKGPEEIWRVILKSSCVDATRVKKIMCSPLIDLPNDKDLGWKAEKNIPLIPNEQIIFCPAGFHCFTGRCVQNEYVVSNNAGDANRDGKITTTDSDYLRGLLSRDIVPYEASSDFDGDGMLTFYDLYRIEHLVAGDIPANVKLPVRTLSLSVGDRPLVGASNTLGVLREGGKTWNVEIDQKGASRSSCRPIVFNAEFPRRDQFNGLSTYQQYTTLNYKRVRFIPDCDILSTHEVNNQLREYIIYSTLRKEGIPVVDVAGFARVKLNSSDKDIDHDFAYEYMFLQRDKEEKDQIPFMNQFGLSQVLEYAIEPFNSVDYGRSNHLTSIILQNLKEDEEGKEKIIRAEKELELVLDPDVSMRYWVLMQLFELGDHGVFGNEDYGLDAKTGLWKNIPYDMDSSFQCGNPGIPYIWRVDENINPQRKAVYYSTLHRVAREIFDNPDTLNRMLLLVDKFPFEDNKDKMKNTLRWRFYYYALYFGSEEFSKSMGQTHVMYTHYQNYLKEAKRILDMKDYKTMCSEYEYYHELDRFVNPNGSGGSSPAVPVPRK